MTQQKVKTLEEKNVYENAEHKNIFQAEKVGCKNSVIWNHKYSDLIHVDPNHTNLNQPIQSDLTNIGLINDSADICVIEKILSFPVHLVYTPSQVPATPIFPFGTASDHRSQSHDSLEEIVTH